MSNRILILCLSSALLFSGCEPMVKPDREKGYVTEYAMSAVEYTIFQTEEISVMANVLSTRSAMGNQVSNGTYSAEREVANTEEGISKLESVKTAIITTVPAVGYETDRQTLLDQTDEAIEVLKEYKGILEDGKKTELNNVLEKMNACVIAVGGEANVFYE